MSQYSLEEKIKNHKNVVDAISIWIAGSMNLGVRDA